MSFLRQRVLFLSIILTLSLSAACGGGVKQTGDCPPTDANKPKFTATGEEGSISGAISLHGDYKPALLDMSNDAACANRNKQAVSDEVVASGGKLQNVFLFIKDGTTANGKKLSDFSFDIPATEVKIDQIGCVYTPHIVGARTGQKVSFSNSDQTVHNVNVQPKVNEKFNQSQASGAPPIVKSFCQPEQAVRIKCNQHGWMSAWVNVMSHPFFAVSGADGTFTINGIPPGQYTIIAWHEKFGEKAIELSLAPKGRATANVTFDAAQTASVSKGSLTLGALELPWPHTR